MENQNPDITIGIGPFDPKDLADLIKNNKKYGWKPGMTVRLMSCNTGSSMDDYRLPKRGFAQALADELNTKVIAPNDLIYIPPNGKPYFEHWYGEWLVFYPNVLHYRFH